MDKEVSTESHSHLVAENGNHTVCGIRLEETWCFPKDGTVPVYLPAGADPTNPPQLCRVCSKFLTLQEETAKLDLVKNNDFTVEEVNPHLIQ